MISLTVAVVVQVVAAHGGPLFLDEIDRRTRAELAVVSAQLKVVGDQHEARLRANPIDLPALVDNGSEIAVLLQRTVRLQRTRIEAIKLKQKLKPPGGQGASAPGRRR